MNDMPVAFPHATPSVRAEVHADAVSEAVTTVLTALKTLEAALDVASNMLDDDTYQQFAEALHQPTIRPRMHGIAEANAIRHNASELAARLDHLTDVAVQVAVDRDTETVKHPFPWVKPFPEPVFDPTSICALCPDPIDEGSSYMAIVEIEGSRIVNTAHIDCADVLGFEPRPGQRKSRIKARVSGHGPDNR